MYTSFRSEFALLRKDGHNGFRHARLPC
jgi:hypothetical protein